MAYAHTERLFRLKTQGKGISSVISPDALGIKEFTSSFLNFLLTSKL